MSVYQDLISKLAQKGISSPRLEAREMIAHISGCDSSAVSDSIVLTDEQQLVLQEMVCRRTFKHEPLDKILGHREFYKYDFIVNSHVLSPRPETEIIVEQALVLAENKACSVLDLGTGSGCILLSILKSNPLARGIGIDISTSALEVAAQNAEKLELNNQVKWIKADWFDKDFCSHFHEQFDLIVTNPPYIKDEDILHLDDEVRFYDPLPALSGGHDGYASYRRLAEIAPQLLKRDGYILLECGIGQASTVAELFTKSCLSLCEIKKDLQSIDRCVILQK